MGNNILQDIICSWLLLPFTRENFGTNNRTSLLGGDGTFISGHREVHFRKYAMGYMYKLINGGYIYVRWLYKSSSWFAKDFNCQNKLALVE